MQYKLNFIPLERLGISIFKCNGKFAFSGGSNGHSEEASVEVYDPEVGKWAHGPSLPVALSNIGK
jgi:hypothetical protein